MTRGGVASDGWPFSATQVEGILVCQAGFEGVAEPLSETTSPSLECGISVGALPSNVTRVRLRAP